MEIVQGKGFRLDILGYVRVLWGIGELGRRWVMKVCCVIGGMDMEKNSWIAKIMKSDAAKFKPGVAKKIIEDWKKEQGK